ncbi:DNA polymerase type-X family protein pol4 [Penicillium rolfsii]|nr:DNA polymerase type-X family protein pol4 [Penicillium rolfsii]
MELLHETENKLVRYGGVLTYDITEASVILGKISQKKRAALELRSRGVWTEEMPLARSTPPSTSQPDQQPPAKRRKTNTAESAADATIELVDLSTESESEEDGVQTRHAPAKHIVQPPKQPENTVVLLKLEWLDHSIAAGEALPWDSFIVYRGQKTTRPISTTLAESPSHKVTNEILQRAKKDAASQPLPDSSKHFYSRRSREPPDSIGSQRQPPTLYRETTSEHDEVLPPRPQPDWVRDQVLYACLRSAPLHPPNEDFISQLVKIRRIRELTLDEIGVRAYSTSIAAIAAYPYIIRRPSEILSLPGCEAKIANLFAEFQQHGGCNHTDDDGNVAAANALETDPTLRVLDTFNNIWGVGAKTAREFYYHRGWRDLDDIIEHGWNSLSRVQQIGVKFYDEFQAGVSRRESEVIAEIIRRHANKVRPEADGKIQCIIVGGYRRGKQLSGDVDVILTHHDEDVTYSLVVDVVASLEAEHYVTHTLSLHLTSSHREQQTLPYRGDETGKHFDTLDKALVVWQDPDFDNSQSINPQDANSRKKNPNPHRRVDIIISPWHTIGCAVLGWSGDTTFQRDLRRYVKKAHSWKFDSSGVRERTAGGQVLDLEHGGETWEERERLLMERLGIGWRPPQERCTR